jgi:formate dehydrogenase iron-sulfur subunit
MTAAVAPPAGLLESASPEPPRIRLPLVQQYLRAQQDLSAVERFARRHAAHELPPDAHQYRDLIPLERPRPGQQYAFEVDLDACTGCKACVTACHRLNGLDGREAETWRSVGLLQGGTPEAPVQQTVTTACHHCLDPACMKGCPVGAYEKDPATGIVKHLDDQCIGCQYCTLTCPYEVPQYSRSRGIVRKCDMCSDRLAASEPPACVQACPNQAISVRIADVAEVVETAQVDNFLPGAPSPAITLPTTRYRSERVMPKNLLPADFYSVRSSHNHMPLAVMLVLTQLSVGAFVVDLVLARAGLQAWLSESRPWHSLVAAGAGLLALLSSTLHLGRPLYAFRALIGLRTSWLSREILAFGVFAGLSLTYAGLFWSGPLLVRLGAPPLAPSVVAGLALPLALAVATAGATGVACSVMLYAVTRREWWSAPRTAFRFFATSAVLGLVTALVTCALGGVLQGFDEKLVSTLSDLTTALFAATVIKVLGDASVLVRLRDRRLGELKRTALLLTGPLARPALARLGLAAAGGAIAPALLGSMLERATLTPAGALILAAFAFVLLLGGELLERVLFFRALSAPKMPGAFG